MVRKQLYITPEIDRELTIVARKQSMPVAALVREVLEKYLKIKKKEENPAAILLKLAKKNSFIGPSNLSTNLTSYLYGEKSPNYGKRKKIAR